MCKRVSIRPGVVSADIFSFLIFYEVSLSVHKGELLSVDYTQFTGAAKKDLMFISFVGTSWYNKRLFSTLDVDLLSNRSFD